MTDAKTEPRSGVACSFCTKRPSQVDKMIGGAGVFICNECVELCVQIIADTAQQPSPADFRPWEQRLSDEELLEHLPRVAAASDQVTRQLTTWVQEARSRGITWTRIGAALGMTRQSAWERFSSEE